MSEKLLVEIITPDKSLLKTEAIEVIIPSYEGEMGILKDHIPLITFLRPGIILIKDNEEKKYFVEEGVVEFSNNNLLILTSTAKSIDNLKNSFIDEAIKKSVEVINKEGISDKDRYLLSYKIEVLKSLRK
jgi:ATP synthase F1 epsilon subunit